MQLPAIGLFSLALPDGIKAQHDEPFHGQIGRDSLVLGFPFLGMAGLQKHGRVTAWAVRPIEIGGNVKARQTLVN